MLASMAGVVPQLPTGAYSPTKAALIMLTEMMAQEWAPDGIRANAVCPGFVHTSMTDANHTNPGLAPEHRPGLADGVLGPAELTGVAALDLAAEHVAEQLLAVADGHQGHAQVEQFLADARAVGLEHAGRTARQDDGAGGVVVDDGLGLVERMDLAIDPRLAHPAGDQLGHLAAEIDDQDALVVGGVGHERVLFRSVRSKVLARPRPSTGSG